MKDKITKPDFTNQTIYVGIDVHLKSWSVTFRSGGLFLGTHSMEPDPEKLSRYLHSHYPNGIYNCVYEAGFCGLWIQRELSAKGICTIVVNPADVPTSGKEKVQKSDVVDSKKLARELEDKSLTGIYIPSEADESLRSLSRLRFQLTRDMVRLKNRIKSNINRLGIPLPTNHEMAHWSRRFIDHLLKLPFKYETDRMVIEQLVYSLLQIRENILAILRKLRIVIKQQPDTLSTIMHLVSVPGVGIVTAIALKTELIDIRRFKHLDELRAYVGLVPAIHDSGETKTTLGMTNRHLPYLRNMLIEAAWIAVRKDPALLSTYNRLLERMKKTEAIIRIAKKLLNRIMTVWKQQTEYVHAVVI